MDWQKRLEQMRRETARITGEKYIRTQNPHPTPRNRTPPPTEPTTMTKPLSGAPSHPDTLAGALDAAPAVSDTPLLSALTEAADALRPFAHFWTQWNRQPMRGMADTFYAIHTGTEYAAELSRTDCERAAQALATLTELAPADDR